MATKKIKVTMTTTKRCKVSFIAGNTRHICPVCDRQVEVLTKAQAMAAFAVTEELLETLVKRGLIHVILAATGEDLICSTSLAATMTATPPDPKLNLKPDSVNKAPKK